MSLTQSDVIILSTVSFELYPAQILGPGYTNAKVVGIVDADTARSWIDPVAMHAMVYPTLPEGTVNGYNQYLYLQLRLANGTITAVGLPWIREETWVVNNTRTLQFTVTNITPEAEPRIRALLAANGYSAVEVKFLPN